MTDRLWIVTIKNKELAGEPDIGACLVEATSADDALAKSHALDQCHALAERGDGRCVPTTPREIRVGRWVRASWLVNNSGEW